MKKTIIILLITVILFNIGNGVTIKKSENVQAASQETVSEKIIRFHVIANSDSKEDQALKLKVRDEVLKYIAPKLSKSKNIDESRKIILKNDKNIKKIAEDVIKKNNKHYSVKTTLSNENFPVKEYGNITLPEGNYEAYRIIIGSGKGHNWWCVMFPPLCFVDISKGEVAYKETENEMKKVLNDEEYNLVDNKENTQKNKGKLKKGNMNSDKIIIKSKIYETLKNLGTKACKNIKVEIK